MFLNLLLAALGLSGLTILFLVIAGIIKELIWDAACSTHVLDKYICLAGVIFLVFVEIFIILLAILGAILPLVRELG